MRMRCQTHSTQEFCTKATAKPMIKRQTGKRVDEGRRANQKSETNAQKEEQEGVHSGTQRALDILARDNKLEFGRLYQNQGK